MQAPAGRIDVVGAGAWGLSAAVSLLERGASEVHVWEREHAGTGATGRAAGLVSTHLRQESDISLVLETRRRLLAIRDWGREQELPFARSVYQATGSLTTVPKGDRAQLEQLAQRIERAGGTYRFLEGSQLSKGPWPFVGIDDMVGIHSAEDGYVEAQDLVDLLGARAKALGAKIHPETPVQLRFEGNVCGGLETTTRDFVRSSHVLLAAGAWSKALLSRSRLPLAVKPYRTQLAQIEYPSRDMPIYHDTAQLVYSRPDGPNRILVGDGTERVETTPERYNAAVDDWFVEKIAAAVSARWRNGEHARYRTGWAGLCVATPDRDPLVGPYPGISNLSLMVGDNGFGVMRCLALGAVAARTILGPGDVETRTYEPRRVSMDVEFEVREGFEI